MQTATISFKAKKHTMYDFNDKPLYDYVVIPEFKRSHCDMGEFRQHNKYGAYANSDLFIGMLKRVRKDILNGNAFLRLDQLQNNIKIEDGFLLTVTITI